VRIGRALGIGALGVVGGVLALPVLVFVVVVALTLVGVTHLYRVPSSAMEPTLHCSRPQPGCEASHKDRIFAVKYLFASPGRGDIVVFHTPSRAETACGSGGVFIKRVVGLPGERWQEQKGRVYIDGQLLREPYITAERRDTFTQGPVRIPKGSYFVLGDNRSGSCDSRRWGPLPRGNIIGRVIATYWPLSRIALH
jgi:signal peptidase I